LVGDEQPKPRTKGKMPQYKVCLAFAELADVALDDFAVAIITGLTDNLSYPTPPVTVVQLATLKSTFEDATVAAATRCGRAATASEKRSARRACPRSSQKRRLRRGHLQQRSSDPSQLMVRSCIAQRDVKVRRLTAGL
jgi:hypothetical protein